MFQAMKCLTVTGYVWMLYFTKFKVDLMSHYLMGLLHVINMSRSRPKQFIYLIYATNDLKHFNCNPTSNNTRINTHYTRCSNEPYRNKLVFHIYGTSTLYWVIINCPYIGQHHLENRIVWSRKRHTKCLHSQTSAICQPLRLQIT